jgi:hypothetical protein
MYYALDWSQHRDRSIIVNTIESTGTIRARCSGRARAFGDVAMFRIGRGVHHWGVMVSPVVFVHVLNYGRVYCGRIDDPPWGTPLDSFYHALEK